MSDALDPSHGPYRVAPKDPKDIANEVAFGLVSSYAFKHKSLDRLAEEIADELREACDAGEKVGRRKSSEEESRREP